MVELYRIRSRIGRSIPTGKYEVTRIGTQRMVHKFGEVYVTDLGEFSPEKWRIEISKAIEADKESDVLNIIIEHCGKCCAWLHREEEIRDYAMNILAGRVFLCGNECWKDVTDKVKDKYFIFEFKEEIT